MIKVERQNRILKYLEINKTLSISTIAEDLGCSEETIRKDLIELEKDSKLVRTHGGAYTENKYDRGFSFEMRETLLKKEKEYMSKIALEYIKSRNSVMLDDSTTCIELMKKIIESDMSVTVITNSLQIANLCTLSKNIKLISIGGKLNRINKSFIGYNATEMISTYNADISFLSYPEINMEFGLGDNSLDELKFRDAMKIHSKKTVLLMDHTKFEGHDSVVFSKMHKVDIIITDKKPNNDWIDYFNTAKIQILY